MKNNGSKTGLIAIFVVFIVLLSSPLFGQQSTQEVSIPELQKKTISDRFEIGFHFSHWSIDPLEGILNDELSKRIAQEVRDEVAKTIMDSYPLIYDIGYDHELLFDSGGSNFGLEIRYYPQGKQGAFSFGVSFEKNSMKITLDGPVEVNFSDNTYSEVKSTGYIELNPFTTNLSFRWDTKPSWRVTPYFVFGFGIAALNGNISYAYDGVYYWQGPEFYVGDDILKTFKEAEEEMDFNIPNIFPLIQVNIGIRAEIVPHLNLNAEAGIWNGFILRGGLSYRF
jgi:hypothetical protein